MASATLANLSAGVCVRVENFVRYQGNSLSHGERYREVSFQHWGVDLFFLRHFGDFICVRDNVFTLRLNADTELAMVEV